MWIKILFISFFYCYIVGIFIYVMAHSINKFIVNMMTFFVVFGFFYCTIIMIDYLWKAVIKYGKSI